MRFPLAIYRIKENEKLSNPELFSYLQKLGITDISSDFSKKNLPYEIDSLFQWKELQSNLQDHTLGWIQDICLHYIAYDCNNPILQNIWEYGQESSYSSFLDMDWDHSNPNLKGKLLAPFLSQPYDECLENGKIQLQYQENGLSIQYEGWQFPIKVSSYFFVFSYHLTILEQTLGKDHPDIFKFLGILYMFQSLNQNSSQESIVKTLSLCKSMLWEFYNQNSNIQSFINTSLSLWNGKLGSSSSFDLLDDLLSQQFFCLSFNKLAYEEINYRIWDNDIYKICLNLSHPKVFRHIQDILLKWLLKQQNLGLKIVYGDAISNIGEYCQIFHNEIPHTYWVMEKKWAADDSIACLTHIQGTTGNTFQNFIQKILSPKNTANTLINGYRPFAHITTDVLQLQKQYRALVIETIMMGELLNLRDLLEEGLKYCRWARDISRMGLFRALQQILIELNKPPQNLDRLPQQQQDKSELHTVIDLICKKNPHLEYHSQVLEKYFLTPGETLNLAKQNRQPIWKNILQRFQQLSTWIITKAQQKMAEDYPGLTASTLIGEMFQKPGDPLSQFHSWQQWRQEALPKSWNTTNEDWFYAEDAWARLQVLSEIPEIWGHTVQHWAQYNQSAKTIFHGEPLPNPDLEYFIYQSLVAIYPFSAGPNWLSQAWDWIQMRIKHVHPSQKHETHSLGYLHGIRSFVAKILYPSADNFFWTDFINFQHKISHYGILNSLTQTILKLMCPGIPEFYQNTEVWDFGLLKLFSHQEDGCIQENHQPKRENDIFFDQCLERFLKFDVSNILSFLQTAWEHPEDGCLKLWIIYSGLHLRRQYVELFQQGQYLPIVAKGKKAEHIISFCRNQGKNWLLVILPRWCYSLVQPPNWPIGDIWQDTYLELPTHVPQQWREILSNQNLSLTNVQLPISQALLHFPMGVWISENLNLSEKE